MSRPDFVVAENQDAKGQDLPDLRRRWTSVSRDPRHHQTYPEDIFSAALSAGVASQLSSGFAHVAEMAELGYTVSKELSQEDSPGKPDPAQIDLMGETLANQYIVFPEDKLPDQWLVDQQIAATYRREETLGESITPESFDGGQRGITTPMLQELKNGNRRVLQHTRNVLA